MEKYRAEDDIQRDGFESHCFNMKSTMDECDECSKWIDANHIP